MLSEHVPNKKLAHRIWIAAGVFAGTVVLMALLYSALFGPVSSEATTVQVVVSPNESISAVADALAKEGYVRAPWIFRVAYVGVAGPATIKPGGYELSKSMDAISIAEALIAPPYSAFVTIPVGVRKEQIADILTNALGWTPEQKNEWLTTDTNPSPNYEEGVYFPDTYLIPSNTPPAQVAQMMLSNFQAAFAPYAAEALQKNIPWTRAVTIASLIQREAGSKSDMYLISGIIENRLKVGMPLAIDATLQYIEGNEANGWWPTPSGVSNYPKSSPFNTYTHTGLPPHPIAEPSLAAIDAALNPDTTKCLFYLHDANGQIHCSVTYRGQQANVTKYLK